MGLFLKRFKKRYSRYLVKILNDSILVLVAYILAFLIRLDFLISEEYVETVISTIPYLFILALIVFFIAKIYRLQYRGVTIGDVFRIVFTQLVLSVLFFVPVFLIFKIQMPRSIPVLFFFLSCLIIAGQRIIYRFIFELEWDTKKKQQRTLIIGAGVAGQMIIRQMKREPLGFKPVGIVDDYEKIKNLYVIGIPVLGSIDGIPKFVKKKKIEEIIIATPSANAKQMQRIIKFCEMSGAKFRTLPGPKEIINGFVRVNQIREVQIEDLLNREVVNFDVQSMKEFIKDNVVLVTGAGGSIGSELCRQLVQLNPKKIICLDRAENSLFSLNDELDRTDNKCNYEITIADILDYEKCAKIFQSERPDFVFHAAAYKHVPLMEDHPEEAIHNNIFGTLNVVKLSEKFGVQKFVLISTDKAVKPSSIMGASKRIAEELVQSYPTDNKLKLIIVRFGNVIGSQGSVVPLFKEQIKRNGPVTVTHENMSRFFMTISEAVKLILESARMGDAKETFILDMGEPLKLKDLARHMITLSGLEPDKDIAIEYTGIRPGEKLFEELWTDKERPSKTSHQKILKINGSYFKEWGEFHKDLEVLRNYSQGMNRKEIYAKFQDLIPDYTPYLRS